MIRVGNYYHKYEKIGEGAYSNVYKGYHQGTSKNFAIKEINISVQKKYIDRFREEINIMKNLDNENIVKLYDTFENDNYIYLILEYCKYGDLKGFLNKRALKEEKVKKFMIQIVSALKYLNDNNIYHRDLKPPNILISENYILKISDFGLAKTCNNDDLLNTVCGSPLYMAPEIMKYKPYNTKADLWSLGVIFYQMLTGNTPYIAKNHVELMNNIETQNIMFPAHIKISNDAKDLLLKLLKKTSSERMSWNELFEHKWLKNNIMDSVLFKTNDNKQSKNNDKNNENENEDEDCEDDDIFMMDINDDNKKKKKKKKIKKFKKLKYFKKKNFNNYLEDTKLDPIKVSIIKDNYDSESSLFLSDISNIIDEYIILSDPTDSYSEYTIEQKRIDEIFKKNRLIDNVYYYIYQSTNLLKTYLRT